MSRIRKVTRDEVYCWLTLCPALEWLGGKYTPDRHQPVRGIAAGAQWLWFKLHNNRVYFWLAKAR